MEQEINTDTPYKNRPQPHSSRRPTHQIAMTATQQYTNQPLIPHNQP